MKKYYILVACWVMAAASVSGQQSSSSSGLDTSRPSDSGRVTQDEQNKNSQNSGLNGSQSGSFNSRGAASSQSSAPSGSAQGQSAGSAEQTGAVTSQGQQGTGQSSQSGGTGQSAGQGSAGQAGQSGTVNGQSGTSGGAGASANIGPGASGNSSVGTGAAINDPAGASTSRSNGIAGYRGTNKFGLTNGAVSGATGGTAGVGGSSSQGLNGAPGSSVSSGAVVNEASGAATGGSESREDRSFTQRLRSSLMEGDSSTITKDAWNQVSITSHAGVVQLRGTVKNEGQRRSIEARLHNMPGVKSIDNQLKIGSSEESGRKLNGNTGKGSDVREESTIQR